MLAQTPLKTTIGEIGRRSMEKKGVEDKSRGLEHKLFFIFLSFSFLFFLLLVLIQDV